MKDIPVIRTFDKRGGSPSLQTTTTEVRNIYMVYQQMISLVSLLRPPSPFLQPLEKTRMEKNAWYVCGQVSEKIDDAPILKDYIKSKVSEPPEELFFFSSSHLDRYRSTPGRNKMEFPGAVYFRKIESFMEDNYICGELFVEYCRDAAA